MGILEMLNSDEKDAVNQLKQLVANELEPEMKNDDELFIRFLRARDFNMDLAEDMLRKHLAWRNTNQISSMQTTFIPNEPTLKYLPSTRIGFDKDGNPIRFLDFGSMDIKGLTKSARIADIVKTVVSMFEDDIRCMKVQSKKLNKPIYQWTYILDFDSYSFAKATHKQTIEFLLSLFSTYEANYPERLKAAYIINTSIYFSMMYAVIKPLLSGATVRKIEIFGKDGWKEALLSKIDAEVLPAFLGGNRTDPDGNPLCNTVLMHGKPVPEEFYLTKSANRISTQPDVRKLTVSRKSKALLPLYVDKPGSMLEWEFETESRDIGFELLYKEDTNSSAKKELIPKQRIDAHLLSEAGVYKCDIPGTYVLVFDNTYSWMYRKEIYCKVNVIEPDGTIQRN